jgi:hypothetical protein
LDNVSFIRQNPALHACRLRRLPLASVCISCKFSTKKLVPIFRFPLLLGVLAGEQRRKGNKKKKKKKKGGGGSGGGGGGDYRGGGGSGSPNTPRSLNGVYLKVSRDRALHTTPLHYFALTWAGEREAECTYSLKIPHTSWALSERR